MLSLLARSSAWNRENRDLGRKWGPFGDPTTKKVPMGTRVPSANVSFFSPHYLPAALHRTMKLWGGVEYLHPKALCDLYHQLPLHFQLHPCLCERLDPWDCSWPWIAGTWGGLRRIKVAISGSAPSSTEARVPTTIYFFLERGGGTKKFKSRSTRAQTSPWRLFGPWLCPSSLWHSRCVAHVCIQ